MRYCQCTHTKHGTGCHRSPAAELTMAEVIYELCLSCLREACMLQPAIDAAAGRELEQASELARAPVVELAPASWKPEVYVDGQWASNALRFATKAEAEASASDLASRWTLVVDWRAAPSDEPVNYAWRDGAIVHL